MKVSRPLRGRHLLRSRWRRLTGFCFALTMPIVEMKWTAMRPTAASERAHMSDLAVSTEPGEAVHMGYGACRVCRCPSFGGGNWRDFCNHLYGHHHRDAHC